MEEDIEILEEDFDNDDIEVLEEDKKDNTGNVIELNRLFELNNEEVIDVYEEKVKKEEKNQKIITKVQIGLIIFLIVFAGLFYFFGYDLVEPYIKID